MVKKNENIKYSIILIVCCFLSLGFLVQQNFVQASDIAKVKYKNISISEFLGKAIDEAFVENIEMAKNEYKSKFDTKTDYSFQKYVSDRDILLNKTYEPIDMTSITGAHIVVKTKKPYLRQAAAIALQDMSDDFFGDMGYNLYLVSAYRSYKDQERLWEEGCSTIRCSKIGASEHQLGLAVDIHVANNKGGYTQFSSGYLKWMNENAYNYGFINTYSKGPKIDGKMKEVWHRRYVGIPFATELHENNMSFAERMNNKTMNNQ